MSKRKCTYTKLLLPEIKVMLAEERSHREIEEYFSLIGEHSVHHLLKQEYRREKKLAEGG